MDDQPVTCVSSTAFSALNEMVGLRPSAQGDSPQRKQGNNGKGLKSKPVRHRRRVTCEATRGICYW
ncbi:hypothetical protein ZY50_13385 [Salmonella enterica subsp. enterica]|nr:hypothetical protein [Salmonella enterica subsp. enterica serovar Newport]EAB5692399.1 hypothetical protein [Salmonella enterica subsp. enterica serovar Newport]ECA9704761.1 hypothetical protein [Salmonella enterica subsp. enterica serovar Bredeney]EEB7955070.1 hypothetical protein [Salmonella enterica subsp. enterica serovar Newport]